MDVIGILSDLFLISLFTIVELKPSAVAPSCPTINSLSYHQDLKCVEKSLRGWVSFPESNVRLLISFRELPEIVLAVRLKNIST